MAGRRARGARRKPPRSQHFLRTPELAAEIVRDAGIEPGELVLDIGAGRGRLTEQLARSGARVTAVEVDPILAETLRGRWRNVEVVACDATELTLPDEPFRVVASLPFHRTTDLMHLLLDDPRGALTRADVVVEWNVAVKRAVPWPSSLNGVYWAAFWEAGLARRLPRTAFLPVPAVDAGLLNFRRRSIPLVAPEDAAEYRRFVAHGFRKGLDRAAHLRTGQRLHARELDAHEWAALFDARRPRTRRHGAATR